MKESGAIQRVLAHLIFVGLPASGKTTFIARLLDQEGVEEILKASESTGVMNGVITVNVTHDKASIHAATIDESNCEWREVEFSLSCIGQMGIKCFASTEKACKLEAGPVSDTSELSEPGSRKPRKQSLDMTIVKSKLQKEGFPAVRPLLENKSTLYLSDTGK